jgi:hypothetical protein
LPAYPSHEQPIVTVRMSLPQQERSSSRKTKKIDHKKSAAGWVCIRPQVLGVPPGVKVMASREAMYVAPFIGVVGNDGNNVKELGDIFFRKSFAFSELVGFAAGKILELFGSAAGPIDRCPFDVVTLAYSERHRQF